MTNLRQKCHATHDNHQAVPVRTMRNRWHPSKKDTTIMAKKPAKPAAKPAAKPKGK
jgi:hypothetical protein